MKIILVFFILISPALTFSQTLNNTIRLDTNNLYYDALSKIFDEHKDSLSNKIILIEGKPALQVKSKFDGFTVINTEQNNVYWTKDKKLGKDYAYLIDKPLVRFICRSVFIDSGRVHLSILLAHAKYSNRKKREGSIWQEGLWLYVYLFDPKNESYKLEAIFKGIEI